MKLLSYLSVSLVLFFGSCKIEKVPNNHKETPPFVQLKTGAKFEGSNAERKATLFNGDKIVLGDTTFKTKDVAFYSTGGTTFGNVGRKTFAWEVAYGKINLFKQVTETQEHSTTTMANGSTMSSTTTHHHIYYYIEDKDGAPLHHLSYNNLKPMVMKGTPEFSMLEKYRQKRVVTRAIGYTSLGLVVAAFAFQKPGVAALGIAGGVTWFVKKGINTGRLIKTVLIADKMDGKRGSHKRVE